jgi:hypothetical protein
VHLQAGIIKLLVAIRHAFYSRLDSPVHPAPTNIAGHSLVNFFVTRMIISVKQGDGGHDLTGLTITTLWHLVVNPSLLDWM